MSKFKVVVTDYNYKSLDVEKKLLADADAELIDTFQCTTEEEVLTAGKDADGLIIQMAPVTRKVIMGLNKCRVIARYAVGVDNIDLQAASEKGICVANVPDYGAEEVSDHTILLLLAAARKLTVLNNAVKEGIWDYKLAKPVARIKGKKLGLVGFGRIPRLVAQKMKGFGVEVWTYDPYVNPNTAAGLGVRMAELPELLSSCDYISVHVPLTEQTKHLINDEALQNMKRSAFLINVARGPVVDEKALVKALQQGIIQGAALDVTEKEPLDKESPLMKMDNVIITPHAAWYSEEAAQALQRGAAEQVAAVLQGFYPPHLVNRDLLDNLNLKVID